MRSAAFVGALALAGAAMAESHSPYAVPLAHPAGWQLLEYPGLPAHRIRFSRSGLEMRVAGSAMPVIYPLPRALRVASVRVTGSVEGVLRVPPGRQGEEGFDDYVFRLGLVASGTRTLGLLQRRFAAPWVRTLFALAPEGSGISRIHFLNVATGEGRVGTRRQHPSSDLLFEEVVATAHADGRFHFIHTVQPPVDTLALWLSADGDDTRSVFTVRVDTIHLR